MSRGQFQEIGDFIFDCTARCLWRKSTRIDPGNNGGKLLAFLVEKHSTDYTNEDVERFIWGEVLGRKVVNARLHTEVTKLRKCFEPHGDEYITRNRNPVRLKKTPRLMPSWYKPDLPDERPRLTTSAPKDEPLAQRLWLQATDHEHNRALHDFEWAWILPFSPPLRIQDFYLTYSNDGPTYEDLMPPLAVKALKSWRDDQTKKGNGARVARLEAEPVGLQVRLVGMRFAHEVAQRHHIELAPAKFLYYVAIQQNLWTEELHELRQLAFGNAMRGINEEAPLMLPSTFAIHMSAISSDQKALLRQRDKTPLYPLAWEAGPGELMHGPEYTKTEFLHHRETHEHFPHFNDRGEPDLSLYLRNTVREELSYENAKDDDFWIHGMAVEWRTLAPKLIVHYQSDAPIGVLIEGAKRSPERPKAVSAIDLSVDGITKSFTDGRYPTWGPTSKLALLLALMHRDGPDQITEVESSMNQLDSES